MDNYKVLHDNDLKAIVGGKKKKGLKWWVEPTYEFLKGFGKGFVSASKKDK